ncbi:DUF2062 domain-containing protein [Salinibius halmophilus]|uniref:DUF2062 domain-containing protein n=1 Tax=Salinibius halmophilus TaxID=1853216 RepID=UPI000E662BE7|nr:DUF2062 domain-containing protein [Salinibius halmophilus]
MPRRFFKKHLPTPDALSEHKVLRKIGVGLHEPAIWHLSRRTVARAFAIGLLVAMLPIPMQMAVAALFAIQFRASLPLAVSLVWLTNPITMPPIFYFNYRVGCWMFSITPVKPEDGLSLAWLKALAVQSWLPLYGGSLILGFLLAVVGYFSISGYWHWQVKRRWLTRRRR